MSDSAAIVSDKQLGDVLLLQPSAAYLASQTGTPTALFVRDAFRPLIELMPDCQWGPDAGKKFSSIWTTSWSSRAVWQAFKLRTRQRRLIVNKPRHIRWWYRLLFHEIRLEPPSAEYWARYFWRAVSGLPGEQFMPPRLLSPPESWRHSQAPQEPYILINPTAAWSRKFWSEPQWAEALSEMSNKTALPIVIAGGGSEREKNHCLTIMQGAAVPTLNLAGQTSMQQYLHLLARARVVVCIDGAASHLAQAFGLPTVTLFGPTHEGKWHWPTPRNAVLAARDFNGTNQPGPTSAIPVEAVLKSFDAVRQTSQTAV